jgi:hypothetical protein
MSSQSVRCVPCSGDGFTLATRCTLCELTGLEHGPWLLSASAGHCPAAAVCQSSNTTLSLLQQPSCTLLPANSSSPATGASSIQPPSPPTPTTLAQPCCHLQRHPPHKVQALALLVEEQQKALAQPSIPRGPQRPHHHQPSLRGETTERDVSKGWRAGTQSQKCCYPVNGLPCAPNDRILCARIESKNMGSVTLYSC